MKADINPRHAEFIRQYFLLNRNATAAYKIVYPDCKTPESSASRLLTNEKVLAAIKEQENKVQQAFNIKQEDIIKGLARIAFLDPMEFLEYDKDNRLIFKKKIAADMLKGSNFTIYPEYQSTKDQKDGVLRARLSLQSGDRARALEKLGEHIGMWSKTNDKNPESGSGKDPATDAIGRAVEIINGRIRRRSKKADSDSQDGD